MSLAEGLRAFVLQDPAVVAVIADRFHDKRTPQNADLPRVVARRISRRGFGHLAGAATTFDSLYQLDVYAATGAACEDLADLLFDRLDGYAGKMGATDVLACLFAGDVDDLEDQQDGGESGIHWIAQQYQIVHRR